MRDNELSLDVYDAHTYYVCLVSQSQVRFDLGCLHHRSQCLLFEAVAASDRCEAGTVRRMAAAADRSMPP